MAAKPGAYSRGVHGVWTPSQVGDMKGMAEGGEGGWILGIRDEGTRSKPIEIDQEDTKQVTAMDDSDEDMEEVPMPVL